MNLKKALDVLDIGKTDVLAHTTYDDGVVIVTTAGSKVKVKDGGTVELLSGQPIPLRRVPEPEPEPTGYAALALGELKKLCAERDLPVDGKKADLVTRLETADRADAG